MKSRTAVVRYRDQQTEWKAIHAELMTAKPGRTVPAVEVTAEQKKRMLARGERRVTLDEIIAAYEEAVS